ncbi:Sodium-coupled monocarboxylate transporter 1 [Triplophysa tibetana]|uniref:Sodium-coupled monocarboxylate transporter 1 n=1 Tax=Triplophysa tibetana TaxID=1572043 RepID=A0A5A9PJ45_9TELE|nr:Sodium-coupled monocarboxylate transporter 1 [Triplophysa tibetana]
MTSTPSSTSFSAWDYVVFTLMLVISAGIGLYFAFTGRGQRSSADFLVGGRSMTAVPVALSLTASFMSAITVLGTPVEVYQYGAVFMLICLSYVLMVVVSSEIFLPIFYRLGITSTYEYLEMRYNRVIRLIGTVLFIIQTGGLKAVVWTDVFQVGIMVAGLLAVIVQSVVLQGGFSTIISDSTQGGRLNLWDFDPNPLRRHTFWTIVVGGTFLWTSVYGINQAQLMPFLVLDILKKYPGVPGLFVASAYSGTLSTVSSSVNALAAVTITDLIRPYLSLSDKQLSWASKGMSLFYGFVCIGMAGLASLMGGMLQAAISIVGVIGGPLLGLFSLAVLFPCANSKGGLSGLLCGLALSLWVCIGAQIYHPLPENNRPLNLSTHGCNLTLLAEGLNWTIGPKERTKDDFVQKAENLDRPWLADNCYSLSYLYFCPMGTFAVITVGLIVSIFTGGRQLKLQTGLTLSKEDLTCYKAYNALKEKITGSSGKLDLARELEKTFGKTNSVFCDVELSAQTPRIYT